MIRAALAKTSPLPDALLLLYATNNADKGNNDSELDTRIKLMRAFANTTSGLCDTHIALTKHPYFVDKFEAIKTQFPDARQSFIVGYDTLTRILDAKYYDEGLAQSGLQSFFEDGRLLCALRESDRDGTLATQSEFLRKIARGETEVPATWAEGVDILDLPQNEALDVSSTRIRNAVSSGDDVVLRSLLTPEVYDVVKQDKLYTNETRFPYLTREHFMNCTFSAWHARLKHISPRARIIKPLPLSFIHYLNEDGVTLPQDSKTVNKIEELESDSEFEDEGYEEEDPSDAFQDLHHRIELEIAALGGSVVPKLNWSSPKDAVWITADKTMKCNSPSDVYLLLKSSDFIVHDLQTPFEPHSLSPPRFDEFELVLKKWFNAQPSMEFRCFVKDRQLIGISQRDVNYYEFLEAQSSSISALALAMFEMHLKNGFPDPSCIKSFLFWLILVVFDIYASVEQERAWLMDINAYSPTTDALLFSWQELTTLQRQSPEIRLVSKSSIMNQGPQYASNQVPYDLIDSSDGVDPATFAKDFQQKLAKVVLD